MHSPKKSKGWSFVLTTLLIAGSLFQGGCGTVPESITQGMVSTGDATAYMNGTITLRPMAKAPPLAQRGFRKLALVVEADSEVYFSTVGLTILGNKEYHESMPGLSDMVLRDLLLAEFKRSSAIELIDATADKDIIMPQVKFSMWNGEVSLKPSSELATRLDDLKSQDIDGIMFARERRMGDFMGRTSVQIGSKGVYQRFNNVAVYAGYDVWIIDLKTLRGARDTLYAQARSELRSDIPWKDNFVEYSDAEKLMIQEAVLAIQRANVEQTIRMLKAGRDERS